MKRLFSLLLISVVILALCACGEEKSNAPDWEGQFVVGFGRGDVTGKIGDEMPGFPASDGGTRTAVGILSPLYMNCVAITDEAGNTVLLYSFDNKNAYYSAMNTIRSAVSEATGVPVENILISATHTHSAPTTKNETYLEVCRKGAVQAATDALADRAPATMECASTTVEGMSFVRHYVTNLGNVVGDNFTPSGAGQPVRHTTEADRELRLVRFNRGDKKPILMANWLGHASMFATGTSDFGLLNRDLMTADYVGVCQTYVEENSDCHFILYMGAGGNINPASRIAQENFSRDGNVYGQKLGEYILETAASMTAAETGTVKNKTAEFNGGRTVTLGSVGCGSLGLIYGPYEMFDTVSMAVREDSPFEMTFVLSQVNGSFGYMPTDICYDYADCYEVRTSKFLRGDAEKTVDVYLQLLKDVQD